MGQMIIITTRNDLRTYCDNWHADVAQTMGNEGREALVDAIQAADHPAWGADWSVWLSEEMDGLITETVAGLDALTSSNDLPSNPTTALIAALRAGGYTVDCPVTGSVIVDGTEISYEGWDHMVMTWDGTADGLEDLGWCRAADAMRDEDRAVCDPDVAHGYTFAGWLAAAGRADSASDWDLRAAWRAGEDPEEYR